MLIGVSPKYYSLSINMGLSFFTISYPKIAQKMATNIKITIEIKVPKHDLKVFYSLCSSWMDIPNKSILLITL